MILREIEVENWRCIRRVRIGNLPEGVTVLHSPNRAGKSSLFEAVRHCLYDYDHDSTARGLTAVVPWVTKAIPKVVVDFEVGEARYRITKVFSKSKEGTAYLERWSDGQWVMDVRDPKEASRKVRQLLGAENADAGLNQLLWVEQGCTKLPEPGRLDASLSKRLEVVLGTLVTAQDVDFRKALHERCGRWFTKKMRAKANSPLAQLQTQVERCAAALAEVQQQLDNAEHLVGEYGITEDRIRRAHNEIDEAGRALQTVKQEKEASRERRVAHRQADHALEAAKKDLARAQEDADKHEETRETLGAVDEAFEQAQKDFEAAEAKAEAAGGDLKQAEDAARVAREAEDRHGENRSELDDRRNLLQTHQALRDLDRRLAGVAECSRKIEQRETELAGPQAPSEEQVADLRRMSNEIRSLQAQLEAGGIYLRIEGEKELTVRIEADGEPPQPVRIDPGAAKEWPARQRIRAELPGLGAIEVGRQREDADLEASARRLGDLEQKYRESVQTWQEQPDTPKALDNLNERRIRHEGWKEDLRVLKKNLQALAPEGPPAVQSQKVSLTTHVQGLLERRPQLADWEPEEDDLKERAAAFEREAVSLATARKEAQRRAKDLSGSAAKLADERNRLRNELTARQVSRDETQKQLASLGDGKALKAKVAEATATVENAEQRVRKTALTEAEQTLDERLVAAQTALEKRHVRLRGAEARLNEYRGELRATEGLHALRVDAEEQLHALRRHERGEQLAADAHALLCRLFDECRDSQVGGTTQPIAARVLEWAEHLGLTEYEDVKFQTDFLPQGLVRRDAGPEDQPVGFHEESYGTEEQLALLVRLALGGILAADEPQVVILDDPLAHSDPEKHKQMLDILGWAAEGRPAAGGEARRPGKLQTFILTCHPDRFDYLPGAKQINLAEAAERSHPSPDEPNSL